jgi:hypothetical protein
MKKFHVTKADCKGYNKIYEIKRSRCFFFELADLQSNTNDIHLKIHTNDYYISTTPLRYKSTSRFPNVNYQISKMLTHFFVLQKVLPCHIQQKYFQMIKSKLLDRINGIKSRVEQSNSSNRTTKCFFNFTYKKYRFYLGIYTPYNQYYDPHLPTPNNIHLPNIITTGDVNEHELNDYYEFLQHRKKCTVPSPFVMSGDRRACVMHQCSSRIFLQDSQQSKLKVKSNKNLESEKCFQKWRNKEIRIVKSSHLGISYKTHINANGRKYIRFTPSGYIYQKAYTDYEINTNFRPKTLKKQERRRNRTENQMFRTNTENPITSVKNKLFIARKHKRLFRTDQQITKPIHHI